MVSCKMPDSKHQTSTAVLNPQQPWLLALGLHKTGLVNDQSCVGRGLVEPHPLLLNYWLLKEPGEGRGIFFVVHPLQSPADSSGQFQTHGHTDRPVKLGGGGSRNKTNRLQCEKEFIGKTGYRQDQALHKTFNVLAFKTNKNLFNIIFRKISTRLNSSKVK